jgi:predicted RNA-binding Zn-ribbon protein involved in translation (DUF1610 family)
MASHTCPVCGYADLDEPHVDASGEHSFAICPSCGTQFGHDDATRTHEELRRLWVAEGARWWSEVKAPPEGWSGSAQLAKAGLA